MTQATKTVYEWILFIDHYMQHLTKAKFDHKKAWHLTTRLARKIMLELYRPRVNIMKTFKSRDNNQIARAILWASVCSLDISDKMLQVGFANSPIVTGELVQFLSVNTGVEAIEVLQKRVTAMEESVKKLVAEFKGVANSARTASNSQDAMKTQLKALESRVKKLE